MEKRLKVGLVTVSSIFQAAARPFTKTVFPAPRSPLRVRVAFSGKIRANFSATARISSGESVSIPVRNRSRKELSEFLRHTGNRFIESVRKDGVPLRAQRADPGGRFCLSDLRRAEFCRFCAAEWKVPVAMISQVGRRLPV